MIDVAIIGGGASGFYCAIRIKELNPNLTVAIFEKTGKTLTKVRVSGGGRCNVTNNTYKTSELVSNYPRGGSFLKKIFHQFGVKEFISWLNLHGVEIKIEPDGRIFPISNTSETIAGLFENLATKLNIQIYRHHEWQGFSQSENYFQHVFNQKLIQDLKYFQSKFTVVATGGIPDLNKIHWKSNFLWTDPVPSLFSFNSNNIDLRKLKPLSGVSVSDGKIRIAGEKDHYSGPILITHWGISGPAVLKMSAWMARRLSERNYKFKVLISWVGDKSEDSVRETLLHEIELNSKKRWKNITFNEVPSRLWELLLSESDIDLESITGESNKKQINRLTEFLLRYPVEITGKTTYKEEFVTAGGINLESIEFPKMQIKNTTGLYACGEVLDIDGITGGFNFQAAWSTAEQVAKSIAQS